MTHFDLVTFNPDNIKSHYFFLSRILELLPKLTHLTISKVAEWERGRGEEGEGGGEGEWERGGGGGGRKRGKGKHGEGGEGVLD